MPPRLFRLLMATLLLSHFASASYAADPQPPNIIVILADDLGRGDYSAFGTKDIRTPAIDRICSEGMTFNHFFANSPVCSPTRAALMTGRYPDRVGVPGVIRDVQTNSWGYLAKDVDLLPKVLKSGGYHSALVGKWHLGLEPENDPRARGFDHFHGFLDDMMDDYFTHLRNGHNYMREDDAVIEPIGHATDLFTGWACDYINQQAATGKPFFLYLAYNAPHDPVQPKPDWLAKVKAREPNMPEKRQKLVALIEHMDDGIAQVLKTLEEKKITDNTLVVFSSDNGGVLTNGANNGPYRGAKQMMYDGGLRVPFAARWPAKIKPGTKSDTRALTMDLFPTLCDAARVRPSKGIDGVTFLPTLMGQEQPAADRSEYFVRREGGIQYGGKTIEALRHGDWKLVVNSPFAPMELFNVAADPTESIDLAGKEKRKLADLSAELRAHIQRGGETPWQRARVKRPTAAQALASRVPELALKEVALAEVLNYIAARAGVNVVFDWRRLEMDGIDRNWPVSYSAKDKPLAAMTKELLAGVGKEAHPVLAVDGDVLVVTNAAGAEALAASVKLWAELNVPPRVADALSRHIAEVKFNDVDLADSLDFVRDVGSLKIEVDWDALKFVGISRDATSRDLYFADVPMSQMLRLLLFTSGSKSVPRVSVRDGEILVGG